MANELISILNKRNRVGITNAEFVLFNQEGVIAATLAAVEITGEAVYRADMPPASTPGCYAWRLQRANNDAMLDFGGLCWDGSASVAESELTTNALITPRFDAIDTELGAINTLATDNASNVSALTDLVQLISPLNALETADAVAAGLALYTAPTTAELAAVAASVIAQVNATAGLTPAQELMLIFVRDVASADEYYDTATGKAQKLHKDTKDVLVDKDLDTSSTCEVTTRLTETVP